MKLNLGCGNKLKEGWENIDLVKTQPNVKVMDVLDITEHYKEATVDHIYMEHLIEHFDMEDRNQLLLSCHELLKNNGILEILTPDFGAISNAWQSGQLSITYLSKLIYGWYVNEGTRENEPYMTHKFIYDRATMLDELNCYGFTRIAIKDADEEPCMQPPLSMHVTARKKV